MKRCKRCNRISIHGKFAARVSALRLHSATRVPRPQSRADLWQASVKEPEPTNGRTRGPDQMEAIPDIFAKVLVKITRRAAALRQLVTRFRDIATGSRCRYAAYCRKYPTSGRKLLLWRRSQKLVKLIPEHRARANIACDVRWEFDVIQGRGCRLVRNGGFLQAVAE